MRTGVSVALVGCVLLSCGIGCSPPDPEESHARIPVDLAAVDRDRDLYGTVVDLEGDPVPGARVEALGAPLGRESDPATGMLLLGPAEPSTTTASDGSFVFRLRPGRFLHLRITAPGLPVRLVPNCRAGERVRVVLGEERRLEVLVVDADGAPVPGVEVLLITGHLLTRLVLELGPVTTDGDGRVVFEGLGPGHAVVLAGFAAHGVELPEAGTASRQVALSACRTLEGVVRDGDTGAPLPGARVSVVRTCWRSVLTDDRGRYVLDGWPSWARGNFELLARAEGYGARVVAEGDRDGVDFALHRGDEIVGRVVDEAGEAVPGAVVSAVTGEGQLSATADIFDGHAVRSGPDGRFRMTGTRRDLGPHRLCVTAEGHGWLRAWAEHPAGPPGMIEMGELALPVGRILTGIVRDRDGAPVPRALVTLELPEAAGSREFRSDQTNDLGRFVFPGLTPGKHVLVWGESLFRDSWRAARDVLVPGDRETVEADLRPDPADRLVVRVVDAAGEPIAGVRVSRKYGPPLGGSVETTDDGRATIEAVGLSGQDIVIEVTPPEAGARRFEHRRFEVLDVAGQEETVVLVERGGIGLIIRMLQGAPASGAHVTAVYDDGRTISARTDEDGQVELEIPVGTAVDVDVQMLVDARGPGTERGQDAFRGLLPGLRSPAWDREIALRPAAANRTVEILVLDPQGDPLPEVDLEAGVDGGWSWGRVGSDDDGRVRLAGLPALRMTFSLVPLEESEKARIARGIAPRPLSLVPDGSERVMRFRSAAVIEGEVSGADGRPVTGASVRIFCGDEEIGPGAFSWGGAFRILGLAGCAHRLTAVHEGRSAEITGVVPGQGTAVLRLR